MQLHAQPSGYGCGGKLAIRYGRSIGYFHQFFPYSALKFRAGKDNRNVEYLTVSGKVFFEFPDCPFDDVGSPLFVLRIQMSLYAAVYRTSPFLHRPVAKYTAYLRKNRQASRLQAIDIV